MSALIGSFAVLGAVLAESDDPGGDASRRLSWAITGLLVLAGVIVVATIVFWRLTRPERATSGSGSMRVVTSLSDAAPAADGGTQVSETADSSAVSRTRRPARGAGADSVAG